MTCRVRVQSLTIEATFQHQPGGTGQLIMYAPQERFGKRSFHRSGHRCKGYAAKRLHTPQNDVPERSAVMDAFFGGELYRKARFGECHRVAPAPLRG